MLIRFEVSNFRSIAEPAELSMVAVDTDRDAAREHSGLGESLLTLAAVYGPNASGKSNVVAALAWLRNAIRDSVRRWEDEIPVEPFAFGSAANPTQFAIDVAIDGIRFEYLLDLNRDRVLYEGLFHYPEKKRRRIFERDGSELTLQRGLGKLTGARELLTEKTLALSATRRFGEPLVSRFADQLLSMQTMGINPPMRSGGFGFAPSYGGPMANSTLRWFGEGNGQPRLFELDPSEAAGSRAQALALLRLADLGIQDVVVDHHEVSFPDSIEKRTRRRVRLVHTTDDGSAPLDFSCESEGTKTWFRMIGPVLSALHHGSIMLFDELDASLHPTLSAEVVRLFHDRATNPNGAQLVFTSHDTSLLNHLNRDEVWLTEKRSDGSTRLGALADFAGERVRSSQNLERAYLHGRFGALPEVDQTEVLRAMGLIP